MTNYELKAGVPSMVRVPRQSNATLVERHPGYRSMYQIFTDDLRAKADQGKKFYKIKAELVDPLTGQGVPGWDITIARYPIANRDKLGRLVRVSESLPVDLVGVSQWRAAKCKLMTAEEKSHLLTPSSHKDRCAFYDLRKAKDLQVLSKALRALLVDCESNNDYNREERTAFIQGNSFERNHRYYTLVDPDYRTDSRDYFGRESTSWIQKLLGSVDERYQRFYNMEHQYRYKIPRPPAPRATISVSLKAFAIGPAGTSGLETFEMGYVQRSSLDLQSGRSVAIDIPAIFVPGSSGRSDATKFELMLTSDVDCLLEIV
jgi:hypothetical protein